MPCNRTAHRCPWSPGTCLADSPCNNHCLLLICTCLQHTLCNPLCRRRHRSLCRKCMRLEHCSEDVRSSSKYRTCRMPQQILLFPPGTCPRRRPRTMLQQFVLYQPRTCPPHSPCNHLRASCLEQLCTCPCHTLCMILCQRCPCSLRCKCRRSEQC